MSQSVHGTWLSLTLYHQQVLCRTCSQTVHAIVPTHMLQYRASPRSPISFIDCTWAPHCCHGWLRAVSIDSTAWSSNGRKHRDQHALASANTPLFDLIAPVLSLSECCVPQLCCTVEDRACHGKTCVAASTKSRSAPAAAVPAHTLDAAAIRYKSRWAMQDGKPAERPFP